MLISFAVFYSLERDALQNKIQLVGSDLHAPCIKVKNRHFKGSFFQSAVEKCKATIVPNKQLNMCAWFVDEDKRITIHYSFFKFTGDEAAQ